MKEMNLLRTVGEMKSRVDDHSLDRGVVGISIEVICGASLESQFVCVYTEDGNSWVVRATHRLTGRIGALVSNQIRYTRHPCSHYLVDHYVRLMHNRLAGVTEIEMRDDTLDGECLLVRVRREKGAVEHCAMIADPPSESSPKQAKKLVSWLQQIVAAKPGGLEWSIARWFRLTMEKWRHRE